MIAVETVIGKLVSEYEFVIIPGFGALLSHQIPANYDKDSGTFSPPSKKLAFNEFLKLDDGLLANYISREEKIAHVEAVTYVKKYTDVLRSTLKAEGETSINGIGEFKTNTEGKLVFEPNTGSHFKDEWYGFNQVNARTLEKPSTLSNNMSDRDMNGEEVEVLELNSLKTINVNWVRWVSAAMLAGLVLYFSFFIVNSNTDNKSNLNPFSNLFSENPATVSSKIAVVPAKKKIENVRPSVVGVSVDSNSLTLPVKTAAIEKIATPEAVTATTAGRRFYLIAGSFKGTKQANVLLKELRDKGFTQAMIIPSTQYSSKVKVAVQAYEIERDAYQASAKLKGVIGEAGWVFKMK